MTIEYTFCIVLLDAEVTENIALGCESLDNTTKTEPYYQAKAILGEAELASRQFHQALGEGRKQQAKSYSSRKLALVCQATLIAPDCVVWRWDGHFRAISIAQTSKNGPRVHLPAPLLKNHIRDNGFARDEKALLWAHFNEAMSGAAKKKKRNQRKKRRNR